jgi:tetratricopeptide (TPR) repeat protein
MKALFLLAFLATGPGPAEIGFAAHPEAALAEGDRLVRDERLEEAFAVYAAAYQGHVDPANETDAILAYNLGAVAHRLGHLPQAVLWYRRAAAKMPDDPPLRENLELARRDLESLGVPPAAPPGAWAFWLDHRRGLILAGIALAWAALPLLALRPGLRLQVLMPVAALSCLSFTAGMVVPRLAPRPAVLLQPCPATEDTKAAAPAASNAPGEPAGSAHAANAAGTVLPAGTEIWVTSASTEAGTWSVVGRQGLSCPENSVGLVE